MKIGILGTTANPPHLAHIEMARCAKRKLGLDRIVVVPTNIPPHKDAPEVSSAARLAMARLAVGARKGWKVSDIELRRKGKSYTRDTIRAMQKLYPRDRLYWIIGSDSLLSMPWKWKGGYGILDLCTFVVGQRTGHPIRHVSERILHKVIILKKPTSGVSSTRVRTLLKQGKSAQKFLAPAVLKFIQRNKLYL